MSIAENNKLEEEFEQLIEKFREYSNKPLSKIKENLDLASKYLEEAVKISNEFGIPFGSSISPISNNYSPRKLPTEFKNLDIEIINDICGASYEKYGGWEHSAVC